MLPATLLQELPHDFAIAVRTSLNNHHKAYHVMDIFHHPGVCLSLQKTSHNLRRYLHNSGINTNKLHIIDPLSKVIGSVLESENTTHVAYNLNHMVEASEKRLQMLPIKQRFMIIDGIEALPLVYSQEKMHPFLKTMNAKMKLHHAKGIFVYDKEKLHPQHAAIVHKLVDKVVEMK